MKLLPGVLVSVFTVKNTGICVLSLTLLIAMEEKIGENSSSHDLRDFILKTATFMKCNLSVINWANSKWGEREVRILKLHNYCFNTCQEANCFYSDKSKL